VFAIPTPFDNITFSSPVAVGSGALFEADEYANCSDVAVVQGQAYFPVTLLNGTDDLLLFCYSANSINASAFDIRETFETFPYWNEVHIDITNPITPTCADENDCVLRVDENDIQSITSIPITDTFEFREHVVKLTKTPTYGGLTNDADPDTELQVGDVLVFPIVYEPALNYFNVGPDGTTFTNLGDLGIDRCIGISTPCRCEDLVHGCLDTFEIVIYPVDHPELVTIESFEYTLLVKHELTESVNIDALSAVPSKSDALTTVPMGIQLIDPDDDFEYVLVEASVPEGSGYVFLRDTIREDYIDKVEFLACGDVPELAKCTTMIMWGLPGVSLNPILSKLAVVGIRNGGFALKVRAWKPGTGSTVSLEETETTPLATLTLSTLMENMPGTTQVTQTTAPPASSVFAWVATAGVCVLAVMTILALTVNNSREGEKSSQ
jgi:hypothetical protein